MKMNFDNAKAEKAKAIASRLNQKGFTAYFAGGCVRDALMGQQPHDFDIATSAVPEQVEKLFHHTIPVGKQFGVILVVEGDDQFEIATFRCDGGYFDGRRPASVTFSIPEEDAKRRDFTVNGLFYDPFQEKVIDYVGGEADLSKKIIRAIGDPGKRFDEDKLRLLRAVRFSSSLDFEIDPETWNALCEKSSEISCVSPERIRDELVKIFTGPNPGRGYHLLSDSGLMKVILPEIEAMKGVAQQPDFHPEGDVFIHTGLLISQLKNAPFEIAFGALFHDVGKPPTSQIRNGRVTFYTHEHVGAKMTEEIMRRLRFSNQEIRAVKECVLQHMKFGDVKKMRFGKLKQFMARPTFLSELEVHRIDCEASHKNLENFTFLKERMAEFEKEGMKPRPFLTGHDLLHLGLKQGPRVRQILDVLYEMQLERVLNDREAALNEALKLIRTDGAGGGGSA